MRLPGASFINGRMSMGARLGLLSAIFCASIALLLVLFVSQSWKEIAFAKKEIEGVSYLAKVWPAFHRSAVDLRDGGQAASEFEAARSVYDDKLGSATAAQAFTQATGQTEKMAAGEALIDKVSDASNLTLDPDIDSFYVMDAATVQLPAAVTAVTALAEAAALPAEDATRNIRIAEAMQSLRTANETAVASLESAMKANASGETRKALGDHTAALKQATEALLAQKNALMAGGGAETVAAARQTLLTTDDQVQRGARDELERLLKAREQRLTEGLIFNLALVGTCLLLAAVLALTISSGLSGRISTLLGAMARLIDGDVTIEVPHLDDKNETGRIAETVAAFKQSLVEGQLLRQRTSEQEARAQEDQKAAEAERAQSAAEQAQVVEAIASGLEKLSAGVLTFRINTAFAPHYEKLRTDFNTAMEQLQASMRIVAGNTAGVRSASGEISQASDDLSRRTEQQAASLEETAAALDQITATVRKTAEGAGHAREMVAATKQDAERSSEVVGVAVAAMGEIEGSARQISQIIGVIDEIAFQTNLLALNAGVEAARAGDAGKGFAVVASEVRALAQRSAEAAKEIKTLISASSQQVDRGVSLVGETGEALQRIVAQVAEINGIVAEIAASAQEQATGLQQVNTAVNQMDQVTQQNAAMVEQSTAASHTLASEAEQLSSLIAKFELGSEDAVEQLRSAPVRPAAKAHAPVVAMKTTGLRGGAAPRAQVDADSDAGWDEF